MRIIAGRFKGQEIKTPKNASVTRPTTDRAKEAIFSHLESMNLLDDARILDIYAGTGALGFEALSRGAKSVTFVESNNSIALLIAETAKKLKGDGVQNISVKILRAKAEKIVAHIAESLRQSDEHNGISESAESSRANLFNIIFFDPPYAVDTEIVNEEIKQVSVALAKNGVIMVERSIRTPDIVAPAGYEIYLRKDYGETAVYYLRRI